MAEHLGPVATAKRIATATSPRGRNRSRMGRFLTAVGTGIATLLLSASAAYPSGPAYGSSPQASDREQAFAAALRRLVRDPEGPPGAIAVLQRGNSVRVITVGVGNVETGSAVLPDAHMRIASTAKAYSGAVALALVELGVLRLDDTVGQWLSGTPHHWADITLAQLLRHTSGIPNYADDPKFQKRVITAPLDPIPPAGLLAYAYDHPLRFRPGTRYGYSNSDNIAVALMTEAATGISYARLLQLLVFQALDIRQTTLPGGFRLPAPSLRGYERSAGQPPQDVTEIMSASLAWASGGMVSTPLDQTRFIRGYIGRKLFGPAVQASQFAWFPGGNSEPPGPGVNSAGLAVFRYRTPCGAVFGHTGNYPGYTQLMVATRSGTRSLTVSVNRQLSETVAPRVFKLLRHAEELGVCALMP